MSVHELALDIPPGWWHTSNDRGDWRKFRPMVKGIRYLAHMRARQEALPRMDQVHVTAHIGYPTNVVADPSNAAPVVKAALDGLTDAGVWTDDDSKHVTAVTYRRDPTHGRRGVHTVRLVLEEIS